MTIAWKLPYTNFRYNFPFYLSSTRESKLKALLKASPFSQKIKSLKKNLKQIEKKNNLSDFEKHSLLMRTKEEISKNQSFLELEKKKK